MESDATAFGGVPNCSFVHQIEQGDSSAPIRLQFEASFCCCIFATAVVVKSTPAASSASKNNHNLFRRNRLDGNDWGRCPVYFEGASVGAVLPAIRPVRLSASCWLVTT